MKEATQRRSPRGGGMVGLLAQVMAMLGEDVKFSPRQMAVAKRRSARQGTVRSEKERAERRAIKQFRAHQLPDICYWPSVGQWCRSKGLVIR